MPTDLELAHSEQQTGPLTQDPAVGIRITQALIDELESCLQLQSANDRLVIPILKKLGKAKQRLAHYKLMLANRN